MSSPVPVFSSILPLLEEPRFTEAIVLTQRLTSIPSAFPPGNTHAMADAIIASIADVPDIAVEKHVTLNHVSNVVLRLKGRHPGRRLVFNGHMDTFPIMGADRWTADPAGEVKGENLYGLGASDMKGGIAAILSAMRFLAKHADKFDGEVVATLVGDEESMGVAGTQWLLENVEHTRGDAMISADAGSPYVLRFGEKGKIWATLRATGRSAHAAHVHRGDCAIEKIVDVISSLKSLREFPVEAPARVLKTIHAASIKSEQMSGAGETEVLKNVTVTFGTVEGGRLPNLIADYAQATMDVRLPVGASVSAVEARLNELVARHDGVTVEISKRSEPNWTDPDHEIIRSLVASAETILGVTPAVNMRVGASDARLYRYADIPTVVCGLTSYNMGAPDEHVKVEEISSLVKIFVLAALDFLSPSIR